ncbi:thiol:disulfide interchange protein [Altererythrobacter buctensis]|uniref:Thiol:disulfide interchange protein n=2 Tax=Alteraurantiacibacter buctensis TaxID=1503981 RepID=A0A844YXN0_9SPHN|nr:thiol:disulfide interchange protein [Alteraurantiacibacter buctensis]
MAFYRYLLLVLAVALAPAAAAQAQGVSGRANNIAADLVAEHQPVPGETLMAALVFRPAPGWHGYWSNPGDAGLGMRLDWQLPTGWQAGEPLYPVPHRLLIAGLMNHVYEGDYAVLVPLTVPAGGGAGPVTLAAQWLACTDKVCVPEQASLTLRFPDVAPGQNPFDTWRAALPPLIDRTATFEVEGDLLRIAIPLPASMELADPHLFVGQDRVSADRTVAYARPQAFARDGNVVTADIPLKALVLPAGSPLAQFTPPDRIEGILAFGAEGEGIRFMAEPGNVTGGGRPIGVGPGDSAPLWSLLLAALAGGLLLNLMPCVFPILSLKAMTLARAGESAAGAKREALAYTAGVLLACLAIGGLLLVLRAGGEQVGWAFQLQEPGVVAVLTGLAVLITANFLGLFELPALSFAGSGGAPSAFGTGLLAAFVATPCTGPFMAAALGAALLLPPVEAMLLFALLGLGLALPFLLLGFVPALRSRLPKPGKWMDTFRKVLAVPMGLTALALVWLCWRLGGANFALLVLGAALALISAAWSRRKGLRASAFGGLVASGLLAVSAYQSFERPATEAQSVHDTVAFSEAALAREAAQKPVFLYFTADWCLTCKVNESVAIERDEVRDAFRDAGVVVMRGDWTVRDEAITRFLTSHGAAGVPLYLWYDPNREPQQLPQVLTPDMLVELAEGSEG